MKSDLPPPCPFEPFRPSELLRDDAYFMKQAFNQALKAWAANEVPIGAVIANPEGIIIGRGFNRVESLNDPTAHAETLAITAATQNVGDWRLSETTLYVTKEPCPMCSGALILARVRRVVFALADPKMGCLGGASSLHELPRINHRLLIDSGVLEDECRALIQSYFQLKRTDS